MTRQSSATPRQKPLCVYCGLRLGSTQDHVIARCLFPTPPPDNLITVPACSPCNRRKARDDAFLRDFFASDHEVHDVPVAQYLFQKVARAARRNQSELAQIVQAQRPLRVPVLTPAGLLVDHVHQFRLPTGRIGTALFRVVRGLYFDSEKVIFPASASYAVLRHPTSEWHGLVEDVFKGQSSRVIGSVFACAFMRATEAPFNTLWLLGFYDRAVFTVSTGTPAPDTSPPESV